MSKLLIVESPAKAKTINKYLGKDYVVTSSVGHIRDLPKSNKTAIDIEGGFIPNYETIKGKEKVIKELKTLAKDADEIILAPDPDREGEAIAWHLLQILKEDLKSNKLQVSSIKRVTFNEITESAIKEALKHPRDIDDNLRRAQEARRVLDRLFGYDLSGLIWKKVRYGLSAGRVQSPALRILVEKEREIKAFIPEDYFVITADVKTKSATTFTLNCSEEPRDKNQVEKILEVGNNGTWKVADLKETEAKRSPRAPFTTSTLQQTASSRMGFAPSKTMGVAQKLYEAGYITYMRTDSTTISQTAQKQILSEIEKKYGKKYVEARVYKTKSKNAQEAHEAIRPTSITKENVGSTDEQKKLYRLIWQRTIASQMSDAKILRSKIVVDVEGKENLPAGEARIPEFNINGSRVLFDGWLLADPSARGEDTELPAIKIGEDLDLLKMNVEDKQTQPPQRYSEAGLIKELEKRGIGRPSTYATIIKTLKDRAYADKEGTALRPTDTGEVVSTFLENHFENYISDLFTAEMEDKLDEIANGERDYVKTLTEFYTPFTKDIKAKEGIEKITNLGDAPKEFKCPECGGAMVIKLAKNGKFMSCAKFPDCNGARTIEGKELEGPKETGEPCPDCGNPLVERDGKFGRFIACSNYPKCKFVKKDEELERKNSTGVKCTECKNGYMVKRRGRFGEFYSCSNYPDCKLAIKAEPTGNLCPMCGKLMMKGTKTIPDRCSDKNCPNHRPDKLSSK
ncbi:TPA: type I DNA topoisomerase [Candidatus Campbellbacteria bacterium]|nr:MAG: topoisomerase I, DNA topoisomerase I protein [Candidatus Campbellbacteria bacterium GW2011_OD1_34_28]KKP75029.1 MAG: topoisomerase protein [Candidatus Campbellbacteria bacterium GW2011_GWD2_35_24]KKP75915.1 MAG: topoisomerase I, DNA topoisomerase I protein [Candidatus Campbellbacteria bacterium GW2011_GWC2_35_28]KKP76837.1 MAG: topoisomerase protein [Candidatus Campbellbacteria bacterium GW2011_GWC1_35_31]KKP78763.1 MAG: topoisomerase protein [Candidatus Campbellbacteria bacterium GW201